MNKKPREDKKPNKKIPTENKHIDIVNEVCTCGHLRTDHIRAGRRITGRCAECRKCLVFRYKDSVDKKDIQAFKDVSEAQIKKEAKAQLKEAEEQEERQKNMEELAKQDAEAKATVMAIEEAEDEQDEQEEEYDQFRYDIKITVRDLEIEDADTGETQKAFSIMKEDMSLVEIQYITNQIKEIAEQIVNNGMRTESF